MEPSGVAPSPRSGHALAALAGRLVVFGGVSRGARAPVMMNDVHVLDLGALHGCLTSHRSDTHCLGTMSWETVAVDGQVPSPRMGAACAAANDVVFIHGGVLSDKTLSSELWILRFRDSSA